jgi:hypothetical protein
MIKGKTTQWYVVHQLHRHNCTAMIFFSMNVVLHLLFPTRKYCIFYPKLDMHPGKPLKKYKKRKEI